jgi:signal transduction histidine kinase
VLPLLTSTIAHSLQVPYVAVELTEAGGPRTLAECGRRAPSAESFEMVAHGEPVGRLIVAPRTSGGHFSKRERRLLRNIALHAAVAAEATRLTRDLQDSRERLVLAREEERRRLRRELHDGLGPSLTGVSMQVRAARKLVHGPGRLGEILDALNGDLLACRAEMRQLVDQLRPPALDRGLEAALREQCERLDNERLDVRLHVEGDLHGVVAATEVAVYRIVAESLNNVIQHSGAGRCTVTVHRAGSLRVEIADDGVGIAEPPRRRGVGLASIRERATELGGVCTVSQREPRGTMVRVFLPAGQPSTASVTG